MQRKMACLSAIFLMCSSVTSSVYAIGDGFFLGLQLGQTKVNNVSVPDPITGERVTPSNTGIGARFDLGYNFNPYFAWEAGLARYASTYYKFSNRQYKSTPVVSLDFAGKGIFAVSIASVYVKGGLAILRTSNLKDSLTIDVNGNTVINSKQKNSITARPLVGVGVSLDLNQSWVVDVSWTRILKGGSSQSADFKSIGFSYHFTTKYCGQFVC